MDFEQLCSFEVLYNAYKTARQGKREKQGAAQYEANALACTARPKIRKSKYDDARKMVKKLRRQGWKKPGQSGNKKEE